MLSQDVHTEHGLLEALSPHSRRMRLHGIVNRLRAALLEAITQVDYREHTALVAESRCHDSALRLVADARYGRSRSAHDVAALVAFDRRDAAVHRQWQESDIR